MKISLIRRWYDFYIGVYYDSNNKIIYIFPLPTLGIRISFKEKLSIVSIVKKIYHKETYGCFILEVPHCRRYSIQCQRCDHDSSQYSTMSLARLGAYEHNKVHKLNITSSK